MATLPPKTLSLTLTLTVLTRPKVIVCCSTFDQPQNKFPDANKLGEGGFGEVYKASILLWLCLVEPRLVLYKRVGTM
ncbi:hypothetical protein JHK87_010128 [Glycine soja]|nr:hypothetical protein JHK87_010128 [Glycine soja]